MIGTADAVPYKMHMTIFSLSSHVVFVDLRRHNCM